MKYFSLFFYVGILFSTAIPPVQAGDVVLGKIKYDQMCVSCHGAMGKGNGVAAAALNPKPRDLSDQAYMSKKTDADLIKVIKNGGTAAGLSPSMPSWGSSLSDTDIGNIISYIRTLK